MSGQSACGQYKWAFPHSVLANIYGLSRSIRRGSIQTTELSITSGAKSGGAPGSWLELLSGHNRTNILTQSCHLVGPQSTKKSLGAHGLLCMMTTAEDERLRYHSIRNSVHSTLQRGLLSLPVKYSEYWFYPKSSY